MIPTTDPSRELFACPSPELLFTYGSNLFLTSEPDAASTSVDNDRADNVTEVTKPSSRPHMSVAPPSTGSDDDEASTPSSVGPNEPGNHCSEDDSASGPDLTTVIPANVGLSNSSLKRSGPRKDLVHKAFFRGLRRFAALHVLANGEDARDFEGASA